MLTPWLILQACTSTPVPVENVPEPVVAPAPSRSVLAPSPLELRDQVRAAGLDAKLGEGVSAVVPEGLDDENKDLVALKTGVLFAHTILGVPGEKSQLLRQVVGLKKGLSSIGADGERLRLMDRALEQIENDTLAREDFLQELDAEVRSLPLDEDMGPGEQTGPMLQAGAWLAGIHLVAAAVVEADDAKAAQTLLARPDVARWFSGYIQSDDGDRKLGPTAHAVGKALNDLEKIFAREAIGIDGATEVKAITGQLLELAL